jgi:hypothetical protein
MSEIRIGMTTVNPNPPRVKRKSELDWHWHKPRGISNIRMGGRPVIHLVRDGQPTNERTEWDVIPGSITYVSQQS